MHMYFELPSINKDFTSLHFTSLHFTSLHFTPLHFTSLHIVVFDNCDNLSCSLSLCVYSFPQFEYSEFYIMGTNIVLAKNIGEVVPERTKN